MAYFTTAEFRDLMPDMGDVAKYPDARVELVRDSVESLIEQVCGTSFEVTAYTETVDGSGKSGLRLSQPYVQAITSVTVDGQLEAGYDYTFDAGYLERSAPGSYAPSAWAVGRRNITVVYTAGWAGGVPADLKLAAMEVTRDRVMQLHERSGKVSDRATALTNDFGNVSFSTADPDHPTGLPSADATITRWANYVRANRVA